MTTRIRHLALALRVLPGLIVSGRRRRHLGLVHRFLSGLADDMDAPLPAAMSALDSHMEPATLPEAPTRRLVDVAALLDRRSPLGLCLRRSLARRRFLPPTGVPVTVHFGARLTADAESDIGGRTLTGHAWTVVADQPYHERAQDYHGFATILVWPEEAASSRAGT